MSQQAKDVAREEARTKHALRPSRSQFHHWFAAADIEIGGTRPWDIQVIDSRLWRRVARHGSLGFGEAYIDGWWDCPAIDQMVDRLLKAHPSVPAGNYWRQLWLGLKNSLLNYQNRARSFEVGEVHYDIGNDLFEAMLDTRMTYTCGYWQSGAKTLEQAQEAKLDLICRKLQLAPGMRIVDIGCGWGSFCQYAAERYDVSCVGLTVSKEQVRPRKDPCQNPPIDIRLQDYRELKGEKFDRVLSVGMFEHVGPKNSRTYMEVTRKALREGGLSLIHTIGGNTTHRVGDPFIKRYIFPNGHLPSAAQISRAAEGLYLVEDVHNFGPDYDRTLCAWHDNVDRAWERLEAQNPKYNQRFQRMWRYYLLSCAGAFRARALQLWQWVLSDGKKTGVYASVRD